MAYKHFLRELLGLTIVVSIVLGGMGIILDLYALTAITEHQETLADFFFNESLYFLIFLIPPYFLVKIINRPSWVNADQAYIAMKLKLESSQQP